MYSNIFFSDFLSRDCCSMYSLYSGDGIDCLMRILENENGVADGEIFNIGNPANDVSIRELAERLLAGVARYPGYEDAAQRTAIVEVRSESYYGDGYQDIPTRVPSVAHAAEKLGWAPRIGFEDAIRLTLDFYLGSRKRPLVP